MREDCESALPFGGVWAYDRGILPGNILERRKQEKATLAIQQEQIDRAVKIAKSFGATRLILFGSAVQGLDQARDLDLACDGVEGWKLYELGAQLEDSLRIPIDLIPLTPPTRLTRLIEAQGRVLV